MSQAAAAARHQQAVEELCGAAVRALSGERDLHFRGRRLHRGRRLLPMFAPHLHPSFESDDFGSFRGAADGLALRLRLSDEALHRSLCPAEPVQRLLFELLEQFRTESLVPAGLPGVVHNLRHRHEAWSIAFYDSGLADTASGMLLYTVAQVCRSRVTGEPVVQATEDRIETTRAGLAPRLGPQLAGLRRQRHDQQAYAQHALALAHTVAALLREAGFESAAPRSPANTSARDSERAAFSLVMDLEAATAEGGATPGAGQSSLLDCTETAYRVYTSAYDTELRPAVAVRREQLQAWREQLDRAVAAQQVNIARLARELQALLAQPASDGWQDGQEEGRIDGRRLAQLVASPTERRLFRTEQQTLHADCVLAFLVDCSGSMRQHIEALAPVLEVLLRALEQAGVATELLGFSTGAWNGGSAHRDWRRAGRPARPGRLNEACHLVFKDADTAWRRARPAIAALLKGDLFREGIDGEAVDWACRRLNARSEARRLLVVVSDGCPMDGATALANGASYLDQHLQQVVARHEAAGRVRLHGLGVGLDLSPYYARSHALDLAALKGPRVCAEVLALLGGHRQR